MAKIFDVAVIGGGICGLGIADALIARGLTPVLIEQGEFGQATSANSLRIIHGGFRYLKEGSILRVVRSAQSQLEIAKRFPDIVRPLPCVMPLERYGLKSKIPVRVGLGAFELVRKTVGHALPLGKIISTRDAIRLAPLLQQHVPYGALLWYDLQLLNHVQLVERLLASVRDGGGVAHRFMRATAVAYKDGLFSVTTTSSKHSTILARRVVNAAGPSLRSIILKGFSPPSSVAERGRAWVRAANVVLHTKHSLKAGIGITSTEGRLFFIVPRGSDTLAIGTAYFPAQEPFRREISDRELCGFLAEVRNIFPSLTTSNVKEVEVGILPRDPEGRVLPANNTRIARRGGYLEVINTKYTTFPSVGRKIAKMIEGYDAPVLRVMGESATKLAENQRRPQHKKSAS